MKIFVLTLTKKRFLLTGILPNEETINLKYRIELLEGINADQQRLIFDGRQLDDERTVQESKIEDGSLIQMAHQLEGCCCFDDEEEGGDQVASKMAAMAVSDPVPKVQSFDGPLLSARWVRSHEEKGVLFVKTLTGKILTLEGVKVDETVEAIKYRIEAFTGVPPDQQRVIFAGQQMDDEKTLDYYDIEAGDEILMVLQLRGCACGCVTAFRPEDIVTLKVQMPKGEEIIFPFFKTQLVEAIKGCFEEESKPVSLSCGSEQLVDGKTIGESGLVDGSVITAF